MRLRILSLLPLQQIRPLRRHKKKKSYTFLRCNYPPDGDLPVLLANIVLR